MIFSRARGFVFGFASSRGVGFYIEEGMGACEIKKFSKIRDREYRAKRSHRKVENLISSENLVLSGKFWPLSSIRASNCTS